RAFGPQTGDGLAAARRPRVGAQAQPVTAQFVEAVALDPGVLGAQVRSDASIHPAEPVTRLQARGREVTRVVAEDPHRTLAGEQVPFRLAVEPAEPGLAQHVGVATGHARIRKALRLAVVAPVAAAGTSAVGTGLAEREA